MPSLIINYRSEKEVDNDYCANFNLLLKEPFSVFQLNSQGSTTTKFINWLVLNDPEKNEGFDSMIIAKALLSFDMAKLGTLNFDGKRILQVIKLYNAFSKCL